MRFRSFLLFTALLPLLLIGLACVNEPGEESATPANTPTATTDVMAPLPSEVELVLPAIGAGASAPQHRLADLVPQASWQPSGGVELFNLTTGATADLADGTLGAFSPQTGTVAWSDGKNLRVLDLDSGQVENYPIEGTFNGYISDEEVLVSQTSGRLILDLRHGTTAPTTQGPFELIPTDRVGSTRLFTDTPVTSPGPRKFTVTRPSSPPLEVTGVFAAALVDEQTLVVAAPTTDVVGLTNLVLVNLADGFTERLISVDPGEISNHLQVQVPLDASATRVTWTARYCEADAQVMYLDLDKREIHSTDLQGWVSVAPDGRLALGDGFSTTRLVDPEAGKVLLDVPRTGGVGVVWDSTYTWALAGPQQGHGTACPGS